jgi:hypothetical protein
MERLALASRSAAIVDLHAARSPQQSGVGQATLHLRHCALLKRACADESAP